MSVSIFAELGPKVMVCGPLPLCLVKVTVLLSPALLATVHLTILSSGGGGTGTGSVAVDANLRITLASPVFSPTVASTT